MPGMTSLIQRTAMTDILDRIKTYMVMNQITDMNDLVGKVEINSE
jgi:hypothetical protein